MGSAPEPLPAPGPATAFGVANLTTAAVVTLAVFRGLPERYALVDGPAALVVLLLSVSSVGLLSRARWGLLAVRVAAGVTLALGLALVCALAISLAYLSGIYGPVGQGGVVIFTLVVALVVPYLVALPGLELYWLRSRAPR